MEQHPNKFPLREHLKSKSIIERLYAEGASATAFPLRAVFITLPQEQQLPTASILISVAKKRFRHAVDRNLIKRRIREAYRLNRAPFIKELEANGKKIAIAILYIDNRPGSTDYLKHKMQKLLNNILEKVQKV
jgi:ribonuclease P protein component